jgi:hypothetical protein
MNRLFNSIFIQSISSSEYPGYLIINEEGLKQIIEEMRRDCPKDSRDMESYGDQALIEADGFANDLLYWIRRWL